MSRSILKTGDLKMPKLNLVDLKVGTEIYYGGDMANDPGFGIVIATHYSKSGQFLDVKIDDGRIFKSLSIMNFSSEYDGTGMTKFVKREAYNEWREKQLEMVHRGLYGKPEKVKFGYVQFPLIPGQKIQIYVVPDHGSHIIYDPDRHELSIEDHKKILSYILKKEF